MARNNRKTFLLREDTIQLMEIIKEITSMSYTSIVEQGVRKMASSLPTEWRERVLEEFNTRRVPGKDGTNE